MVQKFLQTGPRWLRFLLIFPLLFLNGFLLFLLINSIGPLFDYLIIAILIAFLLRLTIKYLVSKGVPVDVAIWGVSIISLLIILFSGITLIPLMITQLGKLIEELPDWMRETRLQLDRLSELPIFIQFKNVGFDIDVWLEQVSLALKNALSSGGNIVFNLLAGTLNGVFNTLMILILTIFLLVEEKQFWDGIFSWFPEPWNQKIPVYTQESF